VAADITYQITDIVESKGLSFTQCRGQGYDGASTMSGAYDGVQKLIQDKQPLAVYVHCATHNLCFLWTQHTSVGIIVIHNWRMQQAH